MPSRSNPFYSYQDPAMRQGFDGLAAIMTGGDQQSSAGNRAPAPNAVALADKYRAETQGIVSKNDALNTPPAMLAELFRSGGRVVDDPFTRNPNYVAPSDEPTDFSLTAPAPTMPEPFFNAGRSADEKMGMAIQEALMRGIKVDDIAKLFAQGGYLANVNAGTPDAGMGYMPLFGQSPNNNTALSTGRQDAMSARDANEARQQAESVARIQGTNSANVANINQAGAFVRSVNKPSSTRTGGPGGVKPGTVPTVTPAIGKAMKSTINTRLEGMGFKGVDDRVIDGLLVEASNRFQDPTQVGNFKSATAAVDSVLNDLNAGTLAGFESATQPGGFFSRDKKTLSRNTPAPAPAAPAPAARPLKPAPAKTMSDARNAIKGGADRNKVIERMRQAGFDPKGL